MENSQKIDAYFNNELSSSEKEQFLAELETNAELQKEFAEQKEIVQGIQDYRKTQLINRLNDIKIVSTSQYVAVKVISSIAVVTLVGLGAYFIYFNNTTNTELLNNPVTEEIVDNTSQNDPAPESIAPVENNELETEEEPIANKEEKVGSSSIEKRNSSVVTEEKDTETSEPEVTMPEVVDSFDTENPAVQSEDDISAPANTVKSNLDLRTKFEVEVKMKRKYNFHYQVIDTKLTLFGEFDQGPFEILEINNQGGVDLYLYYQENFYAINQASEEIQSLTEITDQAVKNRLQSLR